MCEIVLQILNANKTSHSFFQGGILGGGKRPATTTVTYKLEQAKQPMPVLQNADISQKALATSFMDAALKAKEKMLKNLPPGTQLEGEQKMHINFSHDSQIIGEIIIFYDKKNMSFS